MALLVFESLKRKYKDFTVIVERFDKDPATKGFTYVINKPNGEYLEHSELAYKNQAYAMDAARDFIDAFLSEG